MTTISANSTIGITLTSPAYTSPIVVNPGVTISNGGLYGNGVFSATGPWTIQNAGSISGNATDGAGVFLRAVGYVTNAASALITGDFGVDISGGTVINEGSIAGARFGIKLLGGGLVSNAATGSISSSAAFAVYFTGAGTVLNDGQIVGSGSGTLDTPAVALFAGGYLSNAATGTISSTGNGNVVRVQAAAGTVVNAGTLINSFASRSALALQAGGLVTNVAGGLIQGGAWNGIYGTGGTVTIVNAGIVTGSAHDGVQIIGVGTVTNQSSGTITGAASAGIYISNAGTVMNAGTIIGNQSTLDGRGVRLVVGGSVTNQGTGSIIGYKGVGGGGPTTVVNSGTITGNATASGGNGVYLKGGGSVTNQNSGVISANRAIFATSVSSAIMNAGTITGLGTNGFGVYLAAGGSVTNQIAAMISGVTGVYGGTVGAMTVVNAGSISGNATSGDGVYLKAGGSVTNHSNGTISGLNGVIGAHSALTVVNAGSLAGNTTNGIGLFLADGGNVTNENSANISGDVGVTGVGFLTGIGSQIPMAVLNFGGIEGNATSGKGVNLLGGSVTNQSGATVSGGIGVYGYKAVVTVVNAGSIAGNTTSGTGVKLQTGGSVTNQSGGTISGYTGIAGNVAVTVVNAGSITGLGTSGLHQFGGTIGFGLDLLAGGTVSNVAIGTISGGVFSGIGGSITNAASGLISGGVFVQGAAGTVINAGNITDAIGRGVNLGVGGSVTNLSSGTITGTGANNWGVAVLNSSGTVVNYGIISGAGFIKLGVFLGGGGSITNAASGSIIGGVDLYSQGTVVNQGGISGYVNFQAGGFLTNAAAASISGGINTVGSGGAETVSNAGIINGGIGFKGGFANRLVAAPGAAFGGVVNGGNTIGATSVSTLEFASLASSGTLSGLGTQFINFGSIAIDTGANWFVEGNTSGLAGTITGFSQGDTIEIDGITVTGSSYAGGVLTLTEASGSATLNLPGGFTTSLFAVTNVAGGAEVRLINPAAGPPSITSPASVTVGVNQTNPVSGISVSESPTISGETFTVVLADANGGLSANTGATGGGGTITPSNGNKTLTISGTLVQVNADLTTLADHDATTPTDTITVNASDSNGRTATPASIAITVDPGPTAGNGSVTEGHGKTVTLTAVVNALITAGIAGDTETLTNVSAAHGTAVLGAGNAVTYTAPASGPDTISYTVADQYGGTATGQLVVTVDPGPTVSPVAVGTPSSGQTVVVGTVTPGLTGDALTLVNTSGAGFTLSGNQVLYKVGTTPTNVSFQVQDQYGDQSPAVTVIIGGTKTGNQTVTGPPGGYGDIGLGKGNQTVNLSGSNNVVTVGNGNSTVSGGQNANVIVGGNGNSTVSLSGSTNSITLGNGNESVTVGGGGNTVAVGKGDSTISLGGSGNTITAGNGNESITLAGSGNGVTLGNGNSTVSGGQNANVIVGGNGNSTVSLSGSTNSITLGNGNESVTVGGGGNTVAVGKGDSTISLGGNGNTVIAGNGNDSITLTGSGNTLSLGKGSDTVIGGTGDTINLAGNTTLNLYGTHEILFMGSSNSTINDFSTGLVMKIGPTAGKDILSNFASDPTGVVDLIGGVGGFTTAAAVLGALKSDGNGGTLLSFGKGSGSLDFMGVAPSALHASNFQIG